MKIKFINYIRGFHGLALGRLEETTTLPQPPLPLFMVQGGDGL